MRLLLLVSWSFLLSASQLAARHPTPSQLSAALIEFGTVSPSSRLVVRSIRCQVLGDPTEFRCSYQQREGSALWSDYSVTLAIDVDHWIVIDNPEKRRAR